MYFKIAKGTKTFNELTKTFGEIEAAHNAAAKLCRELGGIDYWPGKNCWIGGIGKIDFGLNKDGVERRKKGWIKEDPESSFRTPLLIPENQHMFEKIKVLPVVAPDVFKEICGIHSVHLRIKASDMEIIVDADGMNELEKNQDLVEILSTDYRVIEKRIIQSHFKKLGYILSVEDGRYSSAFGRKLDLKISDSLFRYPRLVNLIKYYFGSCHVNHAANSFSVSPNDFLSYGYRPMGICKKCGCTEKDHCVYPDATTCYWLEENLCSRCGSDTLQCTAAEDRSNAIIKED